MALKVSTGLRNIMLGSNSMREIFNEGCSKLLLYSGAAPANADAAVTGTLLCSITNNKATSKAKKKVEITATAVNATEYTVTLNGTAIRFKSDVSATLDEISAGLAAAINVAQGVTVTDALKINNPEIYQKFTVADLGAGTGKITIEAATAGEYFECSVGANLALATLTEDAYGIRFEDYGDIASGILEKLDTQTWEGACIADGTIGYFRIVTDADTGGSSTSLPRLQGSVSTSNSDLILASINAVTLASISINSAKFTFPAEKA